MFLAWAIVSVLYVLVVIVTVGVLDHSLLNASPPPLMPISLGAKEFMGEIGLVVLSVAAILAFISTGNAGLLSSSRYPMPMSKDQLLPGFFQKFLKEVYLLRQYCLLLVL